MNDGPGWVQAIEVRVGPTGVKAKWVRVELRKIETLPGGGLANTFFDFVGQSHWQKNIKSLALDGRLSLQGLLSGGKVPDFDLSPILGKRLRVQGSTLRSRSKQYQAELIRRYVCDHQHDLH